MNKLFFFIKRPPVVLVVGKSRVFVKETISRILKTEVLIFESDLSGPKEIKDFKFFLEKSKLPILVVTNMAEIPFDEVKGLAKALPARGFLVLNFDDETTRQIKSNAPARSLTYGFWEGAEVKATDVNIGSQGTNFKVNYQGNIVPFWLSNLFEKEQIYSVLAAISVGIIREMNLVEISQKLKAL